jgi:hypothetical protein
LISFSFSWLSTGIADITITTNHIYKQQCKNQKLRRKSPQRLHAAPDMRENSDGLKVVLLDRNIDQDASRILCKEQARSMAMPAGKPEDIKSGGLQSACG